ncbi:hypothetical protein F9C11_23410 [Amycolatopsis sp. VS8301801F10]|uniref:hypothetical protein n=1 Tax=Amycolatopsis sp. VS8301801F10 TaxID=2652442 RepID=UPI0038FBECAD
MTTAAEELAGLLSQAGRAVLLCGPAGCGRTTLARRAAGAFPGPVLRATAAEWESGSAFAVLRQLFPDVPTDDGPLPVAGRIAAELLPGTLLVVDDAQLADVDSIRTLSSLLRHHPAARATVLLTAATGDSRARADVQELLARMSGDEVRVPPLDAAEVSELASAHGIALHPTMAERLCRHTLGRPRDVVRLLTEVPRATWAGFDPNLPAPAAVAASVRERISRLSPAAERFVAAAAVLGAGAAVRSVASLADLDGDPLPVLDEACATRLVELAPRGLAEIGPPDPMVRAAVLAGLGPERRSKLQRRAAELVEDPARSLRLLVAASPVPDAGVADRLDALAVERAAAGAWGTAAVLLNDAGRLTEDAELRQARITRAVDALIGAGDVFRAAALAPEVESVRETPLRDAVLGYLAVVRGRAAEAGGRLSRAWGYRQRVERSGDGCVDMSALRARRAVPVLRGGPGALGGPGSRAGGAGDAGRGGGGGDPGPRARRFGTGQAGAAGLRAAGGPDPARGAGAAGRDGAGMAESARRPDRRRPGGPGKRGAHELSGRLGADFLVGAGMAGADAVPERGMGRRVAGGPGSAGARGPDRNRARRAVAALDFGRGARVARGSWAGRGGVARLCGGAAGLRDHAGPGIAGAGAGRGGRG